MRLYLDGCSYTYGHGLPRHQALGHLFTELGGYQVTDRSRPGKSNLAMALDTYNHIDQHDVFILGWTHSSRFTLKYQDQDLDFYPGSHGLGLGLEPQYLDDAHKEIHKYFYTVFSHPFCDHLSDTLVDTTISNIRIKNKKVVAFSWEQRQIKNHINYPYIPASKRLSDGHLDASGTLDLYHYLQNLMP
jgi:hypothetical protein